MKEGTQVGSFVIERQLGRGGFGVVWVAHDSRLGRRAAIKTLLPELSDRREIVERFFNEARAAASIDHPGIVEIYDVGWHEGSAYFAMKLLEGDSLAKRIRAHGFSISEATAIARQVAGALSAAHARGIVHRDLKPDNIILVPDDEVAIGVRATILDFGIAKLFGDQPPLSITTTAPAVVRTATGMMMGTPFYMSPEQCRGAGGVDQRTDVYALGCILFEMLAGRPPFVGEGAGEILGMHQFVETPSLHSLGVSVPPALESLVMRMLAKKPEQRPKQMADVVAELQPFTGARATGEASTAMPRASGVGVSPAAPTRPAVPTSPPTAPATPMLRVPSALASPPAAPSMGAPQTTLGSSSAEAIAVPGKRSKLPYALGLLGLAAAAAAVTVVVKRSATPSAPASDAARVAVVDATVMAVDSRVVVDAGADSTDAAPIDAGLLPDAAVAIKPKPDKPKPDKPKPKPPEKLACDDPGEQQTVEQAAQAAFASGQYSAALAKYEALLECKPKAKRLVAGAFTAACRAKSFAKAKQLFARLGPRQHALAQVCIREGFDPSGGAPE